MAGSTSDVEDCQGTCGSQIKYGTYAFSNRPPTPCQPTKQQKQVRRKSAICPLQEAVNAMSRNADRRMRVQLEHFAQISAFQSKRHELANVESSITEIKLQKCFFDPAMPVVQLLDALLAEQEAEASLLRAAAKRIMGALLNGLQGMTIVCCVTQLLLSPVSVRKDGVDANETLSSPAPARKRAKRRGQP